MDRNEPETKIPNLFQKLLQKMGSEKDEMYPFLNKQ